MELQIHAKKLKLLFTSRLFRSFAYIYYFAKPTLVHNLWGVRELSRVSCDWKRFGFCDLRFAHSWWTSRTRWSVPACPSGSRVSWWSSCTARSTKRRSDKEQPSVERPAVRCWTTFMCVAPPAAPDITLGRHINCCCIRATPAITEDRPLTELRRRSLMSRTVSVKENGSDEYRKRKYLK